MWRRVVREREVSEGERDNGDGDGGAGERDGINDCGGEGAAMSDEGGDGGDADAGEGTAVRAAEGNMEIVAMLAMSHSRRRGKGGFPFRQGKDRRGL